MRTLEYRAFYYDTTVDVSREDFQGPVIYCLWHEYIPIPFFLRSKTQLAILVSRHRDAEWLSREQRIWRVSTISWFVRAGGVGALKALCEQKDFPGFVITPDGPRGPRREMAPGAIFMASKLQIPLVLVGLGYQYPWRNKRAWDQFAIPKPVHEPEQSFHRGSISHQSSLVMNWSITG